MSAAVAATSRHVEAPANASPATPGVSPGGNGTSPETKKRDSRPSEFPIRLCLNITPAMAASLARLHQRMRLKEGVIGRLGLMFYLASQDREYHED
jgi:hypothetical protein